MEALRKITFGEAKNALEKSKRTERAKNVDRVKAKKGKILSTDSPNGSLYLRENGTLRYDFKDVDDGGIYSRSIVRNGNLKKNRANERERYEKIRDAIFKLEKKYKITKDEDEKKKIKNKLNSEYIKFESLFTGEPIKDVKKKNFYDRRFTFTMGIKETYHELLAYDFFESRKTDYNNMKSEMENKDKVIKEILKEYGTFKDKDKNEKNVKKFLSKYIKKDGINKIDGFIKNPNEYLSNIAYYDFYMK